MTRINVVPVEELSDQWLISEYRELPRVIKNEFDIKDAPEFYCLGKGHVKWAKKYSIWVINRYRDICREMRFRDFTVNYPFRCLLDDIWDGVGLDYSVRRDDIKLNRKRLFDKYRKRLDWYKWTNREKPKWLKGDLK